jgi:hypothetical protein
MDNMSHCRNSICDIYHMLGVALSQRLVVLHHSECVKKITPSNRFPSPISVWKKQIVVNIPGYGGRYFPNQVTMIGLTNLRCEMFRLLMERI